MKMRHKIKCIEYNPSVNNLVVCLNEFTLNFIEEDSATLAQYKCCPLSLT